MVRVSALLLQAGAGGSCGTRPSSLSFQHLPLGFLAPERTNHALGPTASCAAVPHCLTGQCPEWTPRRALFPTGFLKWSLLPQAPRLPWPIPAQAPAPLLALPAACAQPGQLWACSRSPGCHSGHARMAQTAAAVTNLIRGSSGGVISRSWVGPFRPMTCREILGFSHPACGAEGRMVVSRGPLPTP